MGESDECNPDERGGSLLRIRITDLFTLNRHGQSIFVWEWVAESDLARGELWTEPAVDWEDSGNHLTMMAAALDESFDPEVGYPNGRGEQHYDVFRPAVLGKWLEVRYTDEGGFIAYVDGVGPCPHPCPSGAPPLDRERPRDMRLIWLHR